MRSQVIALAGGVGGARLSYGLAQCLPPAELTVVVNTGDDFEHLGLTICPDLDTVMYTLASLNDTHQGWGVRGDTRHLMQALTRLGGEDWFVLGDQDVATHLLRTERLQNRSLSQVTAELCQSLGIEVMVVPMSDQPVRTQVHTDQGLLAFQDYFVRRRCAPVVKAVSFDGIERARPSDGFMAALSAPDLTAIVLCPSNPMLSIEPILALPGVRARLRTRSVPVVAVSPFIDGQAVKGPAAKMFAELGLPTTPAGLVDYYQGLLDGIVIDQRDAPPDGVRVLATDTLMRDSHDQARLAREVLSFVGSL
jgi:LPPG:FO 2-phospho-L-lactate transferase